MTKVEIGEEIVKSRRRGKVLKIDLRHSSFVLTKMPPRLARQMGSEYRCYLSVLTGFSSHTSGGPGGRESLPQFDCRVKYILYIRANMAQKDKPGTAHKWLQTPFRNLRA